MAKTLLPLPRLERTARVRSTMTAATAAMKSPQNQVRADCQPTTTKSAASTSSKGTKPVEARIRIVKISLHRGKDDDCSNSQDSAASTPDKDNSDSNASQDSVGRDARSTTPAIVKILLHRPLGKDDDCSDSQQRRQVPASSSAKSVTTNRGSSTFVVSKTIIRRFIVAQLQQRQHILHHRQYILHHRSTCSFDLLLVVMWWFGPCAGCSCRLSDVGSTWVDLRPLSAFTASVSLSRSPRPGLYTARHRVTQELVALKVLDRRLLRHRETRRRLHQEVRVLQLARGHQNLLQLHEVLAAGERLELAFELARGGQVLSRLHSERDASRALQQAALGLQFLHERGVVHAEVRPEHLLYSDDEPDARVLLAAFGRAAPWRALTLRCRPKTRGFLWEDAHHVKFLPPFLLRRKDGLVNNWREAQQLDIWALGVTLYVMLCGCFPFGGENDVADIESRMLKEKLTFPEGGELLSRAAKDLLRRLLEKNPDAAISIEEVVKHPWLNGGVAPAVSWSADMLAQRDLFTARYAEEVAAVACSPSTSSLSNVVGGDNGPSEARSAPPSEVSTLTSVDGPLSSLGGAAGVLKRDTLEVEAEEEEARPSFMSTHGTELLLDEEAQQERPSADCFMRLASLEMGGNNMNTNSDDEDVVAEPKAFKSRDTETGEVTARGRQPVARQKSVDKMWQVLLRQRRFFSSKSLSSGSSNDRS